MPDETRPESQDLQDYEVQDASDTLDGNPGDDPLDRGVIPPERWSAAIRFGSTAEEQESGESLDQLLAGEEPDVAPEIDDEQPEDSAGDEGAGDEDVDGLLLDDGPDPRAGRLVAGDKLGDTDLIASDAGIDGGAATAEEAAVHVVEEEDYAIRSEGPAAWSARSARTSGSVVPGRAARTSPHGHTKCTSACDDSSSTRTSQVGQYQRASIGVPHAGWRSAVDGSACRVAQWASRRSAPASSLPSAVSSYSERGGRRE